MDPNSGYMVLYGERFFSDITMDMLITNYILTGNHSFTHTLFRPYLLACPQKSVVLGRVKVRGRGSMFIIFNVTIIQASDSLILDSEGEFW